MSKDYKDTLLMMKTEFSMRANLASREPEIQKLWEEKNIYQQILDKNKDNTPFILHDGPPYANGDIHAGHALNKILKDFVVRYRSMSGNYAPYVPGWDTHGLPIEAALTKKSKINRKTMEISDFRKLCMEYALNQIDRQRTQFKRLGILGDWDNPYVTLDKKYEAEQLRVFAVMVEKGLIFKGLKPVFWSPSSESALAEAEIEYHDKVSPSIYLAFKVIDGKNVLSKDCEIVIWTTTPWTIPANLAVAVHPDYTYVILNSEDRYLVIAKELVNSFVKATNISEFKIVKEVRGIDLEYITYQHPLNGKVCPVVLADYVTLDSGTGLVHTAPGHGEDDFNTGKKYNLEVLTVVDARGMMTEDALEFKDIFYEDANKLIVEKLKEVGSLLRLDYITHSYPHDWRTQKPIIFRATDQWFASIDALKKDMLEAIKTVDWIPAWGETRIANMIKDRKEWCISRQRVWGVPIPVFYNEDGTEILDKDIILHVADVFEKHGSDAWWTMDAKDLLPQGYTNPHSPNGKFTKETDIMDVWFDSGSSHHAAVVQRGFSYPVDLYLEGSDQYRGWFNSSLSTGVALTRKSPYKAVLTHGFVLDGEGRKMSKSLGNTVDPNALINEHGADVLRLWVASTEFTNDVRISKDIIKQTSEAYRKIRNTFRFLLGNLFDFDNEVDRVDYSQMSEIDQTIISLLNELIEKVLHAYEHYEFDEVLRLIITFMTNELSSFYLDFTKDVLYIEESNNHERRSIQTVFYENLYALVKLLTPIIPHTCEEVYQHMNGKKLDSIYLTELPKVVKTANSKALLAKYEVFKELRDDILKALEEARNNKIIGKSLVSKVVIKPTEKMAKLINSIPDDLAKIFIVSEFVVTNENIEGTEYPSGIIQVSLRSGHTCSRCWKVVDELSEDELCDRCDKIINK
jgi:isoleucyl-tRNA synthetase